MHQDEIQSVYWNHCQVSIFTAVAWTDEGVYSFGVTSDSLSHDKYAATTYLKAVIDDLQSKLTTKLTEVDIFSDGAAQHFKQKYMFLWATSLERRGIKVNWHFSATSHGKGAVDGIGGTIKRTVFRAIKARNHHASNAKQYADCARDVLHSITILHIDSTAIAARKPELDLMWDSVIAVPGTHGVHCVRTLEFGSITVSSYSEQPGVEHCLLPTPTQPDDPVNVADPEPEIAVTSSGLNIIPGKWYAVYLETSQYWHIGEALHPHENDQLYFSFLQQTKRQTNGFKPVRDTKLLDRNCVLPRLKYQLPPHQPEPAF
jgi:hypothetical protein